MGKVIYRGYAKKNDPIYTGRYIISNPKVNLNKIRKRLGNNYYKTIKDILNNAFENDDNKLHKMWVEILLDKYYDKMYSYKLNLRKNQIIFRGSKDECIDFISNLISEKN